MNTPAELRSAHAAGTLPRQQYWLHMRDHHRNLAAYPALLADSEVGRIEITADGIDVVLEDGVRMRWDPEDLRSIPNVMINHGTFEPMESRILAALGAHSRTVLDIGANAGLMSIRMASGGSAQIHAFEPVPGTYRELEHNVRRTDLGDRIHCHRIALGEEAGEVDFYIPKFQGSVAASARPIFPDEENAVVQVPVGRLDDMASSLDLVDIDLVKCDVEGAELFVLRGGLATLREHRPVLMLELLRKWSRVYGYHPSDVLALLEPLGYQPFVVENGRLVEVFEVNDATADTNFFFFCSHHGEERDIVARELGERV